MRHHGNLPMFDITAKRSGCLPKELVYRYLKGWSVTLRDACYFFGWKKKELGCIAKDP